MVASPSRWRGPQVRAPWRHGAMGPSVSRDPWTRPVARAGVGTHECTQIGENGLSAQPPLACRVRPLVRLARRMRLSVTSPAQNALFREGDTPRVRLSVSRRLRSGALVHAVAPLRADVGTQECTQIGENGLSTLFLGTCVHYCVAIRDTNRDASCARWHERLNHHGVPAAPLAGPSRLVGKTGSERVVLLPGWHLRQGVNPHGPLKSQKKRTLRSQNRTLKH